MTDVLERPRILPTPLPGTKVHNGFNRQLGWQPHEVQRTILANRTRNRVVAAGRRAGKSQVGGHVLVPEAARARIELDILKERSLRREFWIVGPEYSDAEKEFRVVWDAYARLGYKMDKPGSYNNPLSGEMRISMFNGRFVVWAKSAKYPGTLVGEGLSGVVFSEAAKLKPSVWDKFIRPTLADFGGWAFFGSTPEGRNWFYDLWMLGQDDGRRDWASWRAPSWCNPHVYPVGVDEELLKRFMESKKAEKMHLLMEEVTRAGRLVSTEVGMIPAGIDPEIWAMFLDMSLDMFGQEVAADFTEYVGRVFKDFDEELHLSTQELKRSWTTYACADHGFTNPTAWLLLQVDPFNERVHISHEYYEAQRTPSEAAQEIKERGLAPNAGDVRVVRFYGDPAQPSANIDFSNILRIASGGNTGGPIQDRLEWIRRFLKPKPSLAHLPLGDPERAPLLTIHPRCKNLIREMGAYRYPETAEQASAKDRPAPEVPLKKDDHTPEALGRFFRGYFGTPWRNVGATGPIKVRVGRR
jgi:hypothetical protein